MTRLQEARPYSPGRVGQPWFARLLVLGVAVALATIALTAGRPVGAWAAGQPNSLTIAGTGLDKPISVRATGQLDLFNALLRQVSWMLGQPGDPIHPDPSKLGPKYTVTVYVDKAAAQLYDLYPQAPGGPRAYRPAAQPSGATTQAWFYASVAMPDALVAAGVPLATPSSTEVNGAPFEDAAGFVPVAQTSTAATLSLGTIFHDQGRTVLLWMVTPFMILLVLFAAARRSRSRAHREPARPPLNVRRR